MIVRQIRLSNQAKDQLIRLKVKTGIQHWNVLCRWALCLSLREPTPPIEADILADSNVEMSWHVFAGEYHELYEALITQRCLDDGYDLSPAVLAKQFRLHLHRGVSYLAATNFVKNRSDLLNLALDRSEMTAATVGEYPS
jgi:DNA sulfur modification protein DndE